MKRPTKGFSLTCTLIILLTAGTVFLNTSSAFAQDAYPANSAPFGMTYGDWGAAYFQYVFSIPGSSNPMLDPSGAACNIAQPSGPVFFLNLIPDHAFLQAGFLGSYAIRTCTIPSKALWIPIAGWLCSNIQFAPSHGYSPYDMRKCAATATDSVDINSLTLFVDGRNLSALIRERRIQTPYFYFEMPVDDNILTWGWSDGNSGSAVADGYFVLLRPLSRGAHVVQFGGAYLSGISPAGLAGSFSVMYNLTVQ